MVSDSDLVDRLRVIIRSSDLSTTTAATVRRRLEEDFDIDLSDRKAFVRDQIDLFLQSHMKKPQNDIVEEEELVGSDNVKEDDDDDENDVTHSEEEEEDERGGTGRKKQSRSAMLDKDAKKRGSGFTKPCGLSTQLQEFVGVPELARTEVVKKLWAYIREKQLQNPKNKRKILCDETLHSIFRVKSIDMFQMNKALTKHIWPIDEEDGVPDKSAQKDKRRKPGREEVPVKSSLKDKQHKLGREEALDHKKQKEPHQKGGGSGFLAPLPLSDALVKFFGTGENALSRANVVKRMWEYIKQNDLQDPSDKRRVLCDDKLKELFEVDSFNGFSVSKLLTAHFIKTT